MPNPRPNFFENRNISEYPKLVGTPEKLTFIPAPIAQTPLANIATVRSPRDSVAHDATHIVQQ